MKLIQAKKISLYLIENNTLWQLTFPKDHIISCRKPIPSLVTTPAWWPNQTRATTSLCLVLTLFLLIDNLTLVWAKHIHGFFWPSADPSECV
jgi:hypothetical protein